jgi:hypothetical protein
MEGPSSISYNITSHLIELYNRNRGYMRVDDQKSGPLGCSGLLDSAVEAMYGCAPTICTFM